MRLNNLKINSIPILLLSENLEIENKNINSSFFSIRIFKNLEAYFYEFQNQENNNKKVNFFVTSKKVDTKKLKKIILNGNKTYLLVLPGYSFSSPRFTTIGNVSKYFLEDKVNPSLLGLGVQSIDLIHKF